MTKTEKDIVINMPQMALEALSENWLYKELGDLHWELICTSLETPSFDLKNDTSDRLYATFVRILFNCDQTIKSFKENDNCKLNGSLSRFGNSMYFSNIYLDSPRSRVSAQLMTTFSIRNASDNTKLAKSEPSISASIDGLKSLPPIGSEYRLLKKGVLKELSHNGTQFDLSTENPLFEFTYDLNPYYDINGVNLLYFAAYPIINDYCESRYFIDELGEKEWSVKYYTQYKDVFYYANCNPQDQIVYRLYDCTLISEGTYRLSSTLSRKSDGGIIARIFTIKSLYS